MRFKLLLISKKKLETDITSEGALTVSSINDQYPPADLHDGDMTTYCKPASQNNWIQFKFSQIYLISHVEIKVHVYTKNYYWLRIGVNGDDP